MDGFYDAETPIIERLKEVMAVQGVFSQNDMATAKQNTIPDESIAVYYSDFSITDPDEETYDLLILQRWVIVPMVRNRQAILTGKPARDRAGELLLDVIKKMNGWRPSEEHGPLFFTAGQKREYLNGMAYAPAMFETMIRIESDN